MLNKLQLQIDPVLKEMKHVLAEARKKLQPVSTRLKAGAPWETTDSIEVRKADELLIKAKAAVADLTQKSEGTPMYSSDCSYRTLHDCTFSRLEND